VRTPAGMSCRGGVAIRVGPGNPAASIKKGFGAVLVDMTFKTEHYSHYLCCKPPGGNALFLPPIIMHTASMTDG